MLFILKDGRVLLVTKLKYSLKKYMKTDLKLIQIKGILPKIKAYNKTRKVSDKFKNCYKDLF
jgi:hypothetical protein